MALKKPEDKINQIKNIIEKESPDILMLLEIGGIESLKDFNRKYLSSNYTDYIMPSNSDRGIEMGYLVKKDFKKQLELKTHINRVIENPAQQIFGNIELKFSRDISELRIINNNKIEFIILLVHLKSKWDREGNDPGGTLRRKAELNSVVELYLQYQKEIPNVPIILAGDFNGNAQKDSFESEFSSIYQKTDLLDALEILQISEFDRHTYYQFNREGKRFGYQLDYIFLPEKLQKLVEKENSGVYRYNLGANQPFVPPTSIYERAAYPSDHYPLVLNLDFLK